MKSLQIILILLIVALSTVGQNMDSTSLGFLNDAVNQYSKNDSIFYADGLTNNVFEMFKDSLTRSFIRGVDILSGKRERVKIQLSKEDKNYIRSCIKTMANFIWPDHLFRNSVRITKDSIFAYHRMKRRFLYNKFYDSSNKSNFSGSFTSMLMKYATIYQFMRPIYFKQKSLVLFYYLRFCDGLCGNDELALYKLENGQYKKWLLLYGGVF